MERQIVSAGWRTANYMGWHRVQRAGKTFALPLALVVLALSIACGKDADEPSEPPAARAGAIPDKIPAVAAPPVAAVLPASDVAPRARPVEVVAAPGSTPPPQAPAAAPACQAPPLDPARLMKLVKNPLSEKVDSHPDADRHRGEMPTFDYAFPECDGLMLVKFRANASAWSLTCYKSCLTPSSSGLGTLELLAEPVSTDGYGKPVRTSWNLITGGPLKGNVVAFTWDEGLGNTAEIDIDSPAAISHEQTDFIFDWLCANKPGLRGFDRQRCGQR